MKKQIKKSNTQQPKQLQLNKTVISTFDAKQVKGGSGSISASGIYCSSDIRYKRGVALIQDSLQKLAQIRGVFYHWRQDEFPSKDFGPERQVGVIAQEVEAVLPEVVHTDEDGYKAVRCDLLSSLLIEGVNAQQTQIEDLQAQQAQLAQQLEALSQQVAGMQVQGQYAFQN